jgi:hypothetical protein
MGLLPAEGDYIFMAIEVSLILKVCLLRKDVNRFRKADSK